MRTSGRRTAGGASSTPSMSFSTRGCSTATATGSPRFITRRLIPPIVLMVVTVTNAGPDADTLHVLPTAWFRNTWSWDLGAPKPVMEASGAASARVEHPFLGGLELLADGGPDGTAPALLFCENETNMARLYGAQPETPYPKDGINDHVIHGAGTVNPDRRGTKCAFWYKLEVPAGATAELRLRLRPRGKPPKAAVRPGLRAGHRRRAGGRPTSSTPSSPRGRPARMRPGSCGRRSAGCCGASSCTTTT